MSVAVFSVVLVIVVYVCVMIFAFLSCHVCIYYCTTVLIILFSYRIVAVVAFGFASLTFNVLSCIQVIDIGVKKKKKKEEEEGEERHHIFKLYTLFLVMHGF